MGPNCTKFEVFYHFHHQFWLILVILLLKNISLSKIWRNGPKMAKYEVFVHFHEFESLVLADIIYYDTKLYLAGTGGPRNQAKQGQNFQFSQVVYQVGLVQLVYSSIQIQFLFDLNLIPFSLAKHLHLIVTNQSLYHMELTLLNRQVCAFIYCIFLVVRLFLYICCTML